MSTNYNKEIALFVSSDPELGATNISTGGDFWTTQFDKPLIFPSREKSSNYTVSLHSGTIWWNARNVTTANNKLDVIVGLTNDQIVLEPGLYGITEISNAVANFLVNNGHTGNEISFVGDAATQKVITTLNAVGVVAPGVQITFPVGGFGDLMGIPDGTIYPLTPPNPNQYVTDPSVENFLADNIANFSAISSFFFHTDLVQNGIPSGNKSSQAIANIQINVQPGSLISNSPNVLLPINADNLAGTTVNQASFWVTSQTGERGLDFGSPDPEKNTLVLLIRWFEED